MGQRHNRRRKRPRSRRRVNNKNNIIIHSSHDTASRLQQAIPPWPQAHGPSPFAASPVPSPPGCSPCARTHCHDRVPSAQLWHNRYTAWHGRGLGMTSQQLLHQQRREASARLEAEQCRLFGGEPGDDVALCFRMLEFFGGLDFIE